jgi:hypothetical protein
MKNIKNKIAALACGMALFAGSAAPIVASQPTLPQHCVYISYTCCGSSFWGDYDLDEGQGIVDFVLDLFMNCNC